jgi:hypothetical protein
MRTRIALDLDGNGVLTDLGPQGSGQDGVVLLGVASLEKTSPWEWLRAYDTNQDGQLDAEDYGFPQLQIWIDSDQDLVPRGREIQSASKLGVKRILIPREGKTSQWQSRLGGTHLAGLIEY